MIMGIRITTRMTYPSPLLQFKTCNLSRGLKTNTYYTFILLARTHHMYCMYLGQSRVRVDRDIPKCAHGRERHLLKMPLIWRVDCTPKSADLSRACS
jgi:hypothetical protein